MSDEKLTINNFQLIKPLLNFDSENDFYHLQIIKRRKENPGMKSNSHAVRSYYISSLEHLEEIMSEVVTLCHMQSARACINLNRRSFEKVALQVLLKVTNQIINKDFKSVRKVYESVCGGCSNEPKKRWIVDIDTKDKDILIATEEKIGIENMLAVLPTKNGYHIITWPFSTQLICGLDVHKDNPTILYAFI